MFTFRAFCATMTVKVAETRVFVTRFTGPLEEGWEAKVADFASVILASARTVPVTVSV